MERKRKPLNYPNRYEVMIGDNLVGKMDPKLIRWAMENKEAVEFLRDSLNGHDPRKPLVIMMSVNGTNSSYSCNGSI